MANNDRTALEARIKQLEQELQASREAKRNVITYKVSGKGAVSVYGLNARFPVTLYASQWERLIGEMHNIQAFIESNRDKLATKPTKSETATA